MKYLPIIATLFVSFGSVLAQDAIEETTESSNPGIVQRISGILSSTIGNIRNAEIPAIGSGAYLSVVECDEMTSSESTCTLVGGILGVNVCREIAGAFVTVCAPKVFGNYVGANGDMCGCCGAVDENGQRSTEKCAHEERSCLCRCQDDRGILVKHELVKAFGRQISWRGCYTPTIAANILAARSEFKCDDGCAAAIAAREAADAAAAEPAAVVEAPAAEEAAPVAAPVEAPAAGGGSP